ncbi:MULTISPECIES: stage II sporulation protein M [Brevibacillus]|uniref:stage II sporulation protein M n=1 Tax=Brevibacillus TaxID=55080 RepID=UPI000E2FEB53|nr:MULTISPECIES: stage II sporulation protein M [Brevibacillus]MBG9788646.1 stage II sporulation protein M [Brevibacillus laterosporus]MED1788880.1 stage II sporulation protein M [Brevibacillus laterosporus]RFB35478.1 stage II sporulation protein M [Brevibacillus sp. VP]
MRNRFGHGIHLYLKENQSLFLFTIVLFTMGIIFGAVLVNSLDLSQRQELLGFLNYFFSNFDKSGIMDSSLHFQQAFGYHLKTILILWVLGMSIIGLPMILLLLFLKGIIVGFTVGFLVGELQWKGVTFALLGVLPQNMLVVPAMLIAGVAGISFSLRLVRTRLVTRRDSIMPHFTNYSILVGSMFIIMTAAALLETFLSPLLMQYAIN